MVEVMKTLATSFTRSMHTLLRTAPPTSQQATADPRLPRDSWTLTGKSGSVSCGVPAPSSWVLVRTRFCLCPPRVCFPGLCKFWRLHGGVNGDLFQEGICRTQVYCTQSPCPCSGPLLTYTSTGDTQTQFWLSLCGVCGSRCTQGLFEPSDCLQRVWGLIINVILPLLLSCWGFSFALGCGVSPQSCSIAVHLPHNVKECSNYCTTALISHASKVCSKFSKPGFSST